MGRSGGTAAEDRQMMTGARALVRALEDAGVTDIQLRLHLETALSSCTQALSLVRPLLPEL